MAIETAADRAAMLSTDDFGVEVTWTLAGGGSSTLDAIFDKGTRATGGLGTEAQLLRDGGLICREAGLPSGYAAGDTVAIESSDYIVQTVEPDGEGMVLVGLERAFP